MGTIKNALTIDVEDYFQVNAFSRVIRPSHWHDYPTRVERNTRRILEILAEADGQGVKATFFTVGWIAEKFPDLVREISECGHEIACHSYGHQLVFNLSERRFKEDTRRSKEILEDISGREVIGYRAPTYSITRRNLRTLEILSDLGFLYDSSIFPIIHDVYGFPEAPRFPFQVLFEKQGTGNIRFSNLCDDGRCPSVEKNAGGSGRRSIVEFPLTTFRVFKRNVPVAGGGYFRLFPYPLTRGMLKAINRKESMPFVFYMHPWELDPGIPKVKGAGFLSTFRTYLNLDKTERRLKRLVSDFRFAPLCDFVSRGLPDQRAKGACGLKE